MNVISPEAYKYQGGFTYYIYSSSALIDRWFYITIKFGASGKFISSAYSPGFSTLGCTVTSSSLTRTSSTATYYITINYIAAIGSRSMYLKAYISNNTLYTYAD